MKKQYWFGKTIFFKKHLLRSNGSWTYWHMAVWLLRALIKIILIFFPRYRKSILRLFVSIRKKRIISPSLERKNSAVKKFKMQKKQYKNFFEEKLCFENFLEKNIFRKSFFSKKFSSNFTRVNYSLFSVTREIYWVNKTNPELLAKKFTAKIAILRSS